MSEKINFQTPPIIMVGFRRPDLTRRMLDSIALARPVRFYVSLDGPREGRLDDVKAVEEIKKIVDEYEDQLHPIRHYSDKNLGCARNMGGSITWFFEHENEGIILEDDCLPNQSFYRFCAEMLERYRDDPHVMQIAGYNHYSGMSITSKDSYRFSYFGWQWGWATWKSAWQKFDIKLRDWDEFKRRGLHKSDAFFGPRIESIERTTSGHNEDSWAFPWSGCMAMNNGLSVVPCYSMVTNIGGGYGCTHGIERGVATDYGIDVREMNFPLVHPKYIIADPVYDGMIKKINRVTPFMRMRAFVSTCIRKTPLFYLLKKMGIMHGEAL